MTDYLKSLQQQADEVGQMQFRGTVSQALPVNADQYAKQRQVAGRMGVELKLDDWDQLGSQVPCLVDLQPSGRFLMEDFFYAGGLPAVMKEISSVLHTHIVTASGKTVAENVASAENFNTEVIKPLATPFKDKAGIAVLRAAKAQAEQATGKAKASAATVVAK